MNRLPVELGRIVRSTAGRDEGRLFVVIGQIDEDYVLIADGDLRKADHPKKKKRMHLKATAQRMEGMQAGARIGDAELRKRLAAAQTKEEG